LATSMHWIGLATIPTHGKLNLKEQPCYDHPFT
jgi:hypothetical protein